MSGRPYTKSELPYSGKGKIIVMKKDQHLPSGAVRMSKEQIVMVQLEKIRRWRPQSEVWPLKNGELVCGTLTLLSGAFINFHIRKIYRLKKLSFLTSYLTCVMPPACISPSFQRLVVLPDLLAIPSCPTCLETRSGLFQALVSVIYPAFGSVFISIYHCRQHGTHLGKDGFDPGLARAYKMSFSSRNIGFLLLFANFGAGYYMTYWRGRTLETIMAKEVEERKIILED